MAVVDLEIQADLEAGVTTKLQGQIQEAISAVESTPFKINLEFDTASIQQAINQLQEAFNSLRNVGTDSFDASALEGLGSAAENASDGVEKLSQAESSNASAADQMASSTEQATSATERLSESATRQNNALKQTENLSRSIGKSLQNWTAAQNSSNKAVRDAYTGLEQEKTATENLVSRIKEGEITTEQFKESFSGIQARVSEYNTTISDAGAATQSFMDRVSSVGQTVMTWFSLRRAVMYAVQAFKEMVSAAVEVDSAMAQLKIVTDETEASYSEFGDSIAQTAQDIGASITDLLSSSTTYARLGYSLDESSTLAEYTSMLKNVGDIEVSDAQEAITSIVKAFDIDVDDIESVMDKLVAVGNNFPISVSEIAEGMTNASSALAAAGSTFDESVALLTAANTTIQNISRSSTGLRTIVARLRNTTTELDELGEEMTTAQYEEMISALTDANVQLTENGEFRDVYLIIEDIAHAWDDLSSMQQSAIAKTVAGTRQQAVFYSMIEQFQEAEGAMDTMADSAGTLNNSYDIYMDTTQKHIESFKAAVQGLSSDLFSSDFMNFFVDLGTGIINVIDQIVNLINKLGGLKTVIMAVVSAFAFFKMDSITAGIQRMITGVQSLGQSFSGLGSIMPNAFTGIEASLSSTLIGFAAVTAGVIALISVFSYLSQSYTRAAEATAQAEQEYQEAATELENLKSEQAEVQDQIQELNELKADGSITLEQEAELENLQAQNAELETQIELQERLVELRQEAQAAAADEQYDTEKSYYEHLLDQGYGKARAGISTVGHGILGLLGFKNDWNDWQEQDTTNISLLEDAVTDYKSARQSYDIAVAEGVDDWTAKFGGTEEDYMEYLDGLQTKMTDATQDISMYQGVLNELMDDMTDPDTGRALKGYEDEVEEIQDILNQVAKLDMNDLEKGLYDIQNFFSSAGGDFLSDALIEATKNGENLEDVLASLGLTLGDIGEDVTLENLSRYFQDIVDAAEEADEAIAHIGGSVDDVAAAFESENQNDDWKSMADYLSQAQDLYEAGLTGVDDFKAAAQFISAQDLLEPVETGVKDVDDLARSADVYVEAWEGAIDKVNRYFDSEDPMQSAINLRDDLVSAGLAEWVGDPDEGVTRWTDQFKTSADAAEAWGLSIDAAEVALHDLEAYSAEFDQVFFAGEGLADYESSLENIKDIYSSLTGGVEKERLKDLIFGDEGWDNELKKYQDDISGLTEDQVVHLRFEYDLAQLQSEIDQVKNQIEAGYKSAEVYSEYIAGNQAYLTSAKNGVGLGQEGIEIPVELTNVESEIYSLQSQLKTVKDEDARIELQAEIVNLQEIEKGMVNAFADEHVEITADSNPDDVMDAWTDFFNEPQTIYVDAELDETTVDQTLSELATGSTIVFEADVNGIPTAVSAVENQKGEIEYSAEIGDAEVALSRVENANGTVTYEPDLSKVDHAVDEVSDKPVESEFILGMSQAEDSIDEITGEVPEVHGVMDLATEDASEAIKNISEKDSTATVDVVAEDEGAKETIDSYNGQEAEATVGVTAEDEGAQETIDSYDGEEVTANVVADTSDAEQAINDLASKPFEIHTVMDIATSDVQASVKEATGGTTEENVKVKVTVEDAGVQSVIDSYDGQEVTATVNLTANDEGVQAVIDSYSGQEATVTVDITAQDEAESAVATAKSAVDSLEDKNVRITETGASEVAAAANRASAAIQSIPTSHNTVISETGSSSVISAANSVASALSSIPTSISTSITTTNITRNVTQNVKEAQGTAHVKGTADASGSWRVGRTTEALVGELGPEIVVRDGRYFTVGDNGAEIVGLQADDIVFNHKQTEAILKNGFVNERGAILGDIAEASGSAFANSLRLSRTSNTTPSSSSKSSSSSSSSKSSSSKSTTKTTTTTKSTTKSSGNSSSSSSKSSSSSNTSSSSSSTKSTSTSETEADDFEETLDWIEIKIDRIERAIDSLDLTMSSTYKTWSTRNSALTDELSKVSEEITIQQQAYDRYMQQANSVGLSSEYQELVKNGAIDITTITDEDLKDKIDEFQEWYEKALDCKDAIDELNESLGKLYRTQFDYVKNDYESISDVFEFNIDMLDEAISRVEEQGYIVSTKYYDALRDEEIAITSSLENEQYALLTSLNKAISSGAIEVYSEEWYRKMPA